ncbi:MAG: protein translocase subunit SecD [Chloroflexi bacterium]|nr:protein translocase subunit SecD [Chloroflexota bacterium]
MRKKTNRWIIPIALLLAGGVWIVLPENPGIHFAGIDRDFNVVRGLDLQGGLRVLMEADLPEDADIKPDQLETVKKIIENRVNGLGVTEPLIQIVGNRRILVELPGIGDPQEAVNIIKETGLLEFVDMGSISREQALSFQGLTIETDIGSSIESPPLSNGEPSTPNAQVRVFKTVMTGAVLEDARVVPDPNGSYAVSFTLTEEGSAIFGEYTSAHVGDFLAIVLDKKVISVPAISSAITTGQGNISGNFTSESANSLAVQLRYGALPIPLRIAESKTVGPTLGQDSLEKSTTAGLIGIIVVLIFMALYYRLPGIVADLGLLNYAILTFALFKIIPVTLTLPGIAGFVLSLGVAVDANVLIFERMKEELRSGRGLRQAIDLGFSRAWPSIRDSNISTLITCAILYWFGNNFGASIVKGFSITLAIGVLVSLFTAITVTRTLLHILLDSVQITQHRRWIGI